tara:strand:+ start:53 stop:2164 length:2112 start_codon:yes stop_codon:yes gene_type:complete
VAEAVVRLRVDATGATRALNNVQKKTNNLQSSFSNLRNAIVASGIILVGRQAVKTSANFEKLNIRLKLLTKTNSDFTKSQQIATDAQKAFGLSATEALEGVTDITARLAPLGSSVEEIRTVFFGFNTAAKLAGASAVESSNAFRQLAQALGSGRLAGDEFRSVSEQVPTVLAPIAKELGVNIGELKKFAAEGKLTSDVVLRALGRVGNEGSEFLQELLENDPTQVFKNFGNATEDLSRAFGDLLKPVVVSTTKLLTKLIKEITKFVNSPIGKTAAIFAAIAVAAKGLAVVIPLVTVGLTKLAYAGGLAAVALNAIPFVAIATAIGAVTTALIAQNEEQKRFNDLVEEGSEAALRSEMIKIDTQRLNILRRLAIAEENNNKRAIASLNKQLNVLHGTYNVVRDKLHEEIKTTNEINRTNKELEASKKLAEQNKKLSADEKKLAQEKADKFKDFKRDQADSIKLLNASINGNREEVQLQLDINKAVREHGEEKRKEIEDLLRSKAILQDKKKEADKLTQKFKELGDSIKDGIVQNLRESITGAQSFGEAMKNVLNDIKNRLIDAALDQLVGNFTDSIFDSAARSANRNRSNNNRGGGNIITNVIRSIPIIGGFFADGGRPPIGKASVVGERGPELFVPNVAGAIIPNNKLGVGDNTTNIVNVSVDASGSSVAGNGADAQQLGAVIGAAVQAQLIKEKRSGGLLAR